MKKTKAAIIGCGNIAGWLEYDRYLEKPFSHIGAYRSRKDIEVVACADNDLSKAEKFVRYFKVPFFTDSIDELLRQRADLVSICVPYRFNESVIKEICRHKNKPKVLFLEKPISNNLKGAQSIVDYCKRNRVKLYVNNRRLAPLYQAVRQLVDKKFRNEVLSACVWCSSGMHAIGIHMVDLIRYLLGEVKSVSVEREMVRVTRLPYSHNFDHTDVRFSGIIKMKSGVPVGFLNSAMTDYTFFELEIILKRGRIKVSNYGHKEKLVYQVKGKTNSSPLSHVLGKEQLVKVQGKPLFKAIIDDIMDGSYSESPVRGEEGLKSYKIIDAMMKSAKTGKEQFIN